MTCACARERARETRPLCDLLKWDSRFRQRAGEGGALAVLVHFVALSEQLELRPVARVLEILALSHETCKMSLSINEGENLWPIINAIIIYDSRVYLLVICRVLALIRLPISQLIQTSVHKKKCVTLAYCF